MKILRFKWTLLLTLLALLVGGVMALQGSVPRSLEVFGQGFMVVRIIAYLLLFVFMFDEITVPLLTLITREPNYAINVVKPYRFRCLFWALFLEFFVSIL